MITASPPLLEAAHKLPRFLLLAWHPRTGWTALSEADDKTDSRVLVTTTRFGEDGRRLSTLASSGVDRAWLKEAVIVESTERWVGWHTNAHPSNHTTDFLRGINCDLIRHPRRTNVHGEAAFAFEEFFDPSNGEPTTLRVWHERKPGGMSTAQPSMSADLLTAAPFFALDYRITSEVPLGGHLVRTGTPAWVHGDRHLVEFDASKLAAARTWWELSVQARQDAGWEAWGIIAENNVPPAIHRRTHQVIMRALEKNQPVRGRTAWELFRNAGQVAPRVLRSTRFAA